MRAFLAFRTLLVAVVLVPAAGTVVAGELQGEALTPFAFKNAYWFVWADYFPETTLSPHRHPARSPAG